VLADHGIPLLDWRGFGNLRRTLGYDTKLLCHGTEVNLHLVASIEKPDQTVEVTSRQGHPNDDRDQFAYLARAGAVLDTSDQKLELIVLGESWHLDGSWKPSCVASGVMY